jgi:hypothetical protein
MAASEGTEVVLHLYDLSMGMARGMSMMFIGKQIDWVRLLSRTGQASGGNVRATFRQLPPTNAPNVTADPAHRDSTVRP